MPVGCRKAFFYIAIQHNVTLSSPSDFSVANRVTDPNRVVDPTTLKLYDEEVEGNDDIFSSLMQCIKKGLFYIMTTTITTATSTNNTVAAADIIISLSSQIK